MDRCSQRSAPARSNAPPSVHRFGTPALSDGAMVDRRQRLAAQRGSLRVRSVRNTIPTALVSVGNQQTASVYPCLSFTASARVDAGRAAANLLVMHDRTPCAFALETLYLLRMRGRRPSCITRVASVIRSRSGTTGSKGGRRCAPLLGSIVAPLSVALGIAWLTSVTALLVLLCSALAIPFAFARLLRLALLLILLLAVLLVFRAALAARSTLLVLLILALTGLAALLILLTALIVLVVHLASPLAAGLRHWIDSVGAASFR